MDDDVVDVSDDDFDDDDFDQALQESGNSSNTGVDLNQSVFHDDVPVECRRCLKKNFGYDNFRPSQWKIIENVLQGKDQLGVMATGYGKSLCFQFPAVYNNELTVCISPLISLMKDQVMKMNDMGIAAALLGSAATKKVTTMKR